MKNVPRKQTSYHNPAFRVRILSKDNNNKSTQSSPTKDFPIIPSLKIPKMGIINPNAQSSLIHHPFNKIIKDANGKTLTTLKEEEDDEKKTMNNEASKITLSQQYYRKPERFFAVNKDQYNIETKVNNSRQYQPISSFQVKFNKELGRVSQNYNKTDSRQIFYKNKTLDCFWQIMPRYDMYKELKFIENRFAGMKFKNKLLPLGFKSKDNLNRFAQKFYTNDRYLPAINPSIINDNSINV